MRGAIHNITGGYQAGQLLVATPQLQNSCFHKSVVLLALHNSEGSMGFVVNQPMNRINFSEVLEYFDGKGKKAGVAGDMPVHFGGPVEPGRGYVLHSAEYKTLGTSIISGNLAMSSSLEILRDIADGKGPEKKMLMMGFSGWGPGQLEAEFEANSWLTVPAGDDIFDIVFSQDNGVKWIHSAKFLGVDPYRISDIAGHA